MPDEDTDYCFKAQTAYKEGLDTCNPFSEAKFESGKCVCPWPYSGATCEDCDHGYKPEKRKSSADH